MGLIGILLYMIPNDDVKIPPEIRLRYSVADPYEGIGLNNGVLVAYYEGEIEGMGYRAIKNSTFHTPGDLQILSDGMPFQFQLSTSFLNDMFEVLLGQQTIRTDISYSTFSKYNFPLDFTSTVLDSAVPGLVDVIGYDINLSARVFNNGAPRFIFSENEMFVTYSLAVDIYDE